MGNKKREWVTVPEAAKLTGYSERYILDLIDASRIRAERATGAEGGRGVWLVYLPSLERHKNS